MLIRFFLFLILIIIIIIPPVYALSDNDTVEEIPIIGYSPYKSDPRSNFTSIYSLNYDLQILDEITDTVRLYGFDPNVTEKIIKIAHERNMNIFLSINIDRPDSAYTLQNVIELSKKYPNTVTSIIFDHSFRGEGIGSDEKIINFVDRIKGEVPDIEVSAAWSIGQWIGNDVISKKMDYILLVSHPYWLGKNVDNSTTYVSELYNVLKSKYDKKVIVETGWPYDGDIIGCATPNVDKQSDYIKNILLQGKELDFKSIVFIAFSESWKPPIGANMSDLEDCEENGIVLKN